jgi:hypothetical protein
MKAIEIALFALSMMICVAGGSFAQGSMGRGGGSGQAGHMYDPKTVETLSGEVISVEQVHGKGWGRGKGGRGGSYGVHLVLKSDKEEVAVHLGPNWYLDKHGLTVAPGNRIEVRGSRITFEGKPAIIAAEVKMGDQSLKLRNEDGLPAWRGQGPPATKK